MESKEKVLFICTHNSARSQLAEGLLTALHGDHYEAFSAGTATSDVHPAAIRVLDEIGINISAQSSKHINDFRETSFDVVVTICDDARETCPFFPGKKLLHQPFNDPATLEGDETAVLEAFRKTRDEIRYWLENQFGSDAKHRRFGRLLPLATEILDGSDDTESKLKELCSLMKDNLPGYDWVGFYLVDGETPDQLILGPYAGAATDHVCIPFGKGICGQVADKKETMIIQDVTAESNYLACSPVVKSEIVVPLFKNGEMVGQLDIDSHYIGLFNDIDREHLERLGRSIEAIL